MFCIDIGHDSNKALQKQRPTILCNKSGKESGSEPGNKTTKNIPNTGTTRKDLLGIEDAQGEQDLEKSSKRKRRDSSSKTTAKKVKAGSKSSEKHDIARKEETVAIWATRKDEIVIGHGIVISNRTKLHGKAIGKGMAVVNLMEVEDEHVIYKLPSPNMDNNPLQFLLKDAKGSAVLWPKEFLSPKSHCMNLSRYLGSLVKCMRGVSRTQFCFGDPKGFIRSLV
jgi:hypothetical protein